MPGMAGPAGETLRKAKGEKSRLCLRASAVAASSLQRCPSMRVATWTKWILELKKSTRPRGTRWYWR